MKVKKTGVLLLLLISQSPSWLEDITIFSFSFFAQFKNVHGYHLSIMGRAKNN